MNKGDIVMISPPFRKSVIGFITDINDDSEFITIKHDNFKGEVFNKKDVSEIFDI